MMNLREANETLNMTLVAQYSYENNDGDQIFNDVTKFYKDNNGNYVKEYHDGYYDTKETTQVAYSDVVAEMQQVKKEVDAKAELVSLYGFHHPLTRGGYSISLNNLN